MAKKCEGERMTVKRFKLVEYLPNVIQIEDNHQKLNSHEIVDLLNELHEENKRLRRCINEIYTIARLEEV